MKYGRSLQELAIELDRQAKVKKDYVATAGAMQMTAVNENFDLVIGNTPFQLNENAHRQLGLQLKIPAPYYERMRAENPGLLMANVNGWFQQSPDTRRMVRTLDGTARAILSDRYRRIDNYEVAQTVLPIISEMQGARIESCELTDTRMYIKVVNERIQTEVVPGDIVQAGILISNSEVGMGSFGMIYLCPRCGAYVGVHKGSDKPLGRLANSELRNWKKAAHAAFDPLWKYGPYRGRRNEAYRWLSEKMGTPIEFTHIGMFDVDQCRKVVRIMREERNQLWKI